MTPNCSTCGGWHPPEVTEQTGGVCPGPLPLIVVDDRGRTSGLEIGETRLDARLVQLIDDYVRDAGEEPSGVRDVITDLYHFCDSNGLDFEELRKAAYEVYVEERDEPKENNE